MDWGSPKARLREAKKAVTSGHLAQPFGVNELRQACPGWGRGTYNAFLWKHSKGPRHKVGGTKQPTELFVRVSPGKFRLAIDP